MLRLILTCLAILVALPAMAGDTPKRGGVLTFMIPANSPPSFDGHREATFATIHAVAPFYSVLIRADPEDPADTDNSSATFAPRFPLQRMAARLIRF